MPYKDPNKRKECQKECDKRYKEKHKQQIKLSKAKYRKTEKGKKNMMLDAWRKNNVKGDLHKIYDEYINTNECYICNNNLISEKAKYSLRNMDHNHITGYYRFTICRGCNIRLGKVDFNFRNVINELKMLNNLPIVIKKTFSMY